MNQNFDLRNTHSKSSITVNYANNQKAREQTKDRTTNSITNKKRKVDKSVSQIVSNQKLHKDQHITNSNTSLGKTAIFLDYNKKKNSSSIDNKSSA